MDAEKRNNSQIPRTKKWLREALIELMKKKPYSQITITELAQRADLSRFSFYAHYKTKDDILYDIVERIMDEQAIKLRNEKDLTILRGWELAFETWIKHKDVIVTIGKQNLLNIFRDVNEKEYMNTTQNFMTSTISKNPEFYPYYSVYHNSAMVNLTYYFLCEEPMKTPRDMAEIMLQLRPASIHTSFIQTEKT